MSYVFVIALILHCRSAPMGSVFVLHTVAHNPTGVDPTQDQWKGIADVCVARQAIIIFDTAYQVTPPRHDSATFLYPVILFIVIFPRDKSLGFLSTLQSHFMEMVFLGTLQPIFFEIVLLCTLHISCRTDIVVKHHFGLGNQKYGGSYKYNYGQIKVLLAGLCYWRLEPRCLRRSILR